MSRGSDQNVVRVQGKVTHRQKQLGTAVITFTDSNQGVCASTIIKPDGTYDFVNRQGGLPFGMYDVTISPQIDDTHIGTSSGPKVTAASHIPRKYQESHTSGMKAKVSADKSRFVFDLID